MEERNELIKELFELHKLLADKGEISIGYGFSENYKRLEAKVKKLTIPVVSKSFAVGVEVEITDCIKGHEYHIGEKVKLVEFDDNMWIARNKKGVEWYINEDEANVC